eukprot:2946027-Rhodomonas_salina.3
MHDESKGWVPVRRSAMRGREDAPRARRERATAYRQDGVAPRAALACYIRRVLRVPAGTSTPCMSAPDTSDRARSKTVTIHALTISDISEQA